MEKVYVSEELLIKLMDSNARMDALRDYITNTEYISDVVVEALAGTRKKKKEVKE